MSSDNQQKTPLSAEHAGLAEGSAAAAGAIGSSLGLTSPNAHGAPCARTTAPTATPGGIFRSITCAHAPTARTRTAWRASATASSASVSRSRLERTRPRPEGVHLRPKRAGGQSRRGRQGILMVSRRDADLLLAALALSLPTSRISLCAPAAEERQPHKGPAGIRASRRRRVRRRSILAK